MSFDNLYADAILNTGTAVSERAIANMDAIEARADKDDSAARLETRRLQLEAADNATAAYLDAAGVPAGWMRWRRNARAIFMPMDALKRSTHSTWQADAADALAESHDRAEGIHISRYGKGQDRPDVGSLILITPKSGDRGKLTGCRFSFAATLGPVEGLPGGCGSHFAIHVGAGQASLCDSGAEGVRVP